METHTVTEWKGKNHLEHRYRGVKGIETRAEGGKLRVNYLYFETHNREKDQVVYKTVG
jgi:hypothetical protein